MKILLLGAKGNLGGQIEKVLSEYDVIAWDREEIDITDKELVEKKIADLKPDIIINTAAYNAVDKCEKDEESYGIAKKLNGDAVGYIADAAIKNNSILIHYSTDYVFDGQNKDGYKEDDETSPVNKYAQTKLMGEREIVTRSAQGLKYYLIRTSKLFGPVGESKVSKPNFFDLMLNLAKDREKLTAVDEEVSCFTYTTDLARETKRMIEEKENYGIYHIVNGSSCTWFEAAVELFKIAKINILVEPVSSDSFPRPAKRPKYSVLLNTKLEPLRDWREALKEYLIKK